MASSSDRAAIELTSMSKESKHGPGGGGSGGGKGGAPSKTQPLTSYDASDEEAGLLGSKRAARHRVVPIVTGARVGPSPAAGSGGAGGGGGDSDAGAAASADNDEDAGRPQHLSLDAKSLEKRRAHVAQYATENFLNLVEFLQLHGLLWAIMFRVPWPTEWSLYSSWTLFANLDGAMYWFYYNYTTSLNQSAGTADPHFNLWGEIRGWGLIYSGLWTALCLGFLVLLVCIHSTKQSFHSAKCWQAPALQRFLQWFFYVLYLPFGIALLRPFACSYSDHLGKTVMDHDTTQECWTFAFTPEGIHGVACVFIGLVAGVFLVYIPAWTMVHLKRHIQFEGRQRHERFLLQKQAEYVLGLNVDYMRDNLSFLANFRQPATAFRFLVYLRRLLFLLIYVFARSDLVTQLGLLWGVQLLWCVALTAMPPFRVRGSNVVMLVLDYTFLALGLLSLLRGVGTNSDAFVDSYFQLILAAVVGAGVVVALLVWLIDGGCLACNPVQYNNATDPDAQTRHWVREIQRVQDTLFELNSKPLELIDLDELRAELKSMAECFHEARESGHILRFTLQDCMEDVQATVDECETSAMFPNAKLVEVLPNLRRELDHQSEVHALVAPRSRRWLRKLESMRLFRIGYRGPQSDSDDDFADWEEEGSGHAQATVVELAARTQAVLMPPVDTAAAEGLKRQWRARIARWKQEFYKNHGARPKKDDMWEIDNWRKNYLLLKDATVGS